MKRPSSPAASAIPAKRSGRSIRIARCGAERIHARTVRVAIVLRLPAIQATVSPHTSSCGAAPRSRSMRLPEWPSTSLSAIQRDWSRARAARPPCERRRPSPWSKRTLLISRSVARSTPPALAEAGAHSEATAQSTATNRANLFIVNRRERRKPPVQTNVYPRTCEVRRISARQTERGQPRGAQPLGVADDERERAQELGALAEHPRHHAHRGGR